MLLSFGVLLCIIAGSVLVMPYLTGQVDKKKPVSLSTDHEEPVVPIPQEVKTAEKGATGETAQEAPEMIPAPVDTEKASLEPAPEPPSLREEIPAPGLEKHRLRILTVEDTWIKLSIDSGSPREYSLKPGDHLELEASTGFQLLIGNAGGIKIQLNGNPFEVAGKSGQVVSVKIP
jgi:hypothetical protein